MLDSRLIAGPGLNPLAVPVQIVDLQLDKFQLRVLGQDFVQQRGVAVEGEAGAPDQALLLFVHQPAKAVQVFKLLVRAAVYAVKQVVVKIAGSGLFKLLVENIVPALQGVKKADV